MGLFDRRRGNPASVTTARSVASRDDDDDSLDPQGMAIELIDAFHDLDTAHLAGLSPAARATQVQARRQVHEYVDAMWESAKRRGLNPATSPDWSGVAGMRDLSMALWLRAQEAAAADEQE
jgi:hypothetical protein